MFSMFLEAIHESLDCSDNDEEALFAICLLCAAIGNKGREYGPVHGNSRCALLIKNIDTKYRLVVICLYSRSGSC